MRQEVVEPDGRDVPTQRFKRHAVIPRRELELLEADPFRHGRDASDYEPRTLTARAPTSRMVTAEIADSRPIVAFARIESGMVSVGLKAIEFVSDT